MHTAEIGRTVRPLDATQADLQESKRLVTADRSLCTACSGRGSHSVRSALARWLCTAASAARQRMACHGSKAGRCILPPAILSYELCAGCAHHQCPELQAEYMVNLLLSTCILLFQHGSGRGLWTQPTTLHRMQGHSCQHPHYILMLRSCRPLPASTRRRPRSGPTLHPATQLSSLLVQEGQRICVAGEADAPVALGSHRLAVLGRLHWPVVAPVGGCPHLSACTQPPAVVKSLVCIMMLKPWAHMNTAGPLPLLALHKCCRGQSKHEPDIKLQRE